MTTIVDVPGVGEIEFPDTMTPEQIQDVLAGNKSNKPSIGSAVKRGAVREFANNALQAPNHLGTGLAGVAGALDTTLDVAGNVLTGQPLNIMDNFRRNFEEQKNLFPAKQLRDVPTVNTTEAMGALRALMTPHKGGTFNERLIGNIATEALEDERFREERPMSTFAGEMLGDAATILAGRAPVMNANRAGRLSKLKTPPATPLPSGHPLKPVQTGWKAVQKRFKGTVKRAAEAGAEGAALGIINDKDPLEGAGLAAGTQVAGTVARNFIPTTAGGAAAFGAIAVGSVAMIRLFQGVVPGLGESLQDAGELAFDKMAVGVLTGIAATALGAGRVGVNKNSGAFTKDLADSYPLIADAITAIPRNAFQSLLQETFLESESNDVRIEPVLETIATDPTYFGESFSKQVTDAVRRGDGTVRETIDKLLADNPHIQKKFDVLKGGALNAQIQLGHLVSIDSKGAKPLPASEIERAVRKFLPKDFALGNGHTGPRALISRVLQNPDKATEILNGLGTNERKLALEANLITLLNHSTSEQGLEANVLAENWRSLPEVVKRAYRRESSFEPFLRRLDGLPETLQINSTALAHSLMANGELSKRLRRTEEAE